MIQGATSPTIGSPGKKDPNAPPQTPLEKLLAEAGPIRADGSDKFFGMENVCGHASSSLPILLTRCATSLGIPGKICCTSPIIRRLTDNRSYCNSILQCLYYSVPFREQVIQYPIRSPRDTVNQSIASPRIPVSNNNPASNGSPTSPRAKGPIMSPSAAALGRKPATTIGATNPPRPEDVKDSPEYKKKHAMLAGPILQMDYENAPSYGMPESLFTSLKDIFEAIVANPSRIGVVSPQKFLDILKRENEMFRGSMHQDAHEFLNLLLNEVVADVEKNTKRLEESKTASPDLSYPDGIKADSKFSAPAKSSTGTNTPTKTAWVHDLFEGTLTSETRCLTCETVSQRDEIFLDLSVDLDEHSSVTSCLRKFSEEEMLCERNKFHCDHCGGLQEAEKRMKIKRLPRVLALHLKRFKYTEDLQRLQKLFHRVVYPYHLRLFNTTDDAEDPDRLYELYAVVVHIGGGPYHGHYVSIIKTQDRGWLLFDDEMVEPVDKNYVQNFFGDRPGLACAYVLFYQETTLEAVRKEQEAENRSAAATAAASSIPKEPVGALSKLNGIVPNGKAHPPKSTPIVNGEVEQPAVSLDQVASAPPNTTTETETLLPPDVPEQLAEAKTKKDRAKEEKEQKAVEKQRAKELETKRKEHEKQQRDQTKAVLTANKQTKVDEEARPDADSNSEPSRRENGALPIPSSVMHNSLSRFKQGSKSINKKFWSSKEKEETPIPSTESLTNAFIPPEAIEQRKVENAAAATEKTEKPKSHRFSLKKKSSTLLL